MKRIQAIIAALALVFIASAASAQISQGTMFIGGQAEFSTTNNGQDGALEEKETSGGIIPNFGYFISDDLAIGLGVGYTGFEREVGGEVVLESSAFVVRPFVRKYNMFSETAGIFGELGVGFASPDDGNDATEEDTQLDANISLGVVFFPSTRLGIEATLGLVGYTSEGDASGLSLGLNSGSTFNSPIGIGVNWYFNR